MSDKTLNFWQRRQPRERWLLVICLISAIAAGLYIAREQAMVWQQRAVNHLQQRQLEAQQIQQLESRMQAVLARQPEKNPGLEQLNRLLPPGLVLSQPSPDLWVAARGTVALGSLLNALVKLEQRYALQPSHLLLEQKGTQLQLMHMELNRDR
ncbi:type II secretion system protein M [Erwinia pyrifoliae]|uniref:Type II secretion system protein M n=1 Tax=Erwinia pyrifoliae TaxID=79967 RepID=A0ABY5X616_ERWPY|nr:type II secretion system protein M [Erwinia pyrifoliae]MCT2387822.1 type II secretion system protein M [Erwinia pyrifoliae]MCU8586078.1 type II secretion system protein M [Erwinia pyrifoliae]UWS32778.1 type II secretion system protein M [Erwinia pyrifoliae]